MDREALIITAASSSYGPALLALLGSLRLNWPGHTPVLVYDIGLDEATRTELARHGVELKRVPEFCPHWRRHFTWKLWALNDAPARDILYIDAGVVVLRPLDDVFEHVAQQGYFLVPNGMPLEQEASEAACKACAVSPDFRRGKGTLAGGFAGFRKEGKVAVMLREVLDLALIEGNIAASNSRHRHDQALLSLLVYRDLSPLKLADPDIYLVHKSPRQLAGQAIWVHRRALRHGDRAHLAARISRGGERFLPRPAAIWPQFLPWKIWSRWFGRSWAGTIYDGVRD